MAIKLTEYIANANPKGAQALLSAYGLKANNGAGLMEGLDLIIKKYREKGFYDVVTKAHPDYKMVTQIFGEQKSNVTGTFLEDISPPINNISKSNPNQVVIDAKLLFAAAAGLLLLVVISKNI